MADALAGFPARRGHFVLEPGYHTDLWLSLDALFVDPAAIAPHVAALADLLRPYAPTAVCGPLPIVALQSTLLVVRLMRLQGLDQLPEDVGGQAHERLDQGRAIVQTLSRQELRGSDHLTSYLLRITNVAVRIRTTQR